MDFSLFDYIDYCQNNADAHQAITRQPRFAENNSGEDKGKCKTTESGKRLLRFFSAQNHNCGNNCQHDNSDCDINLIIHTLSSYPKIGVFQIKTQPSQSVKYRVKTILKSNTKQRRGKWHF